MQEALALGVWSRDRAPAACLRFLPALLAIACSAAPPPPPETKVDTKELDAQLAQRDELREKLLKAPSGVHGQCELTAGDCVIQAREKRTEIERGASFSHCPAGVTEPEARACEDKELLRLGRASRMEGYYRFENWCSSKLAECADGLVAEQLASVHKARVVKRTQELVSAKSAVELTILVELAEERVKYLRTTLPNDVNEVCFDLPEKRQCDDETVRRQAAFEAEVNKQEGKYSREAAARLYSEYRRTEARCYEPEYRCVLAELGRHGETQASRVWLEKNLRVLEKRQTLQHRVPPDASERCLTSAVTRYKNLVVDRYQKYLRQPEALPRAQLHAAFLLMHEDQVSCLTREAT